MRTEFQISIKADLRKYDDETLALLQSFVRDTAETLYAEVAVMSASAPTITVTQTDEKQGEVTIKLFDGVTEYTGE